MYLADVTTADEARMLDEFTMPAARDLATLRPDVVVFGCTSAGALRGAAADATLCARISAVAGAPTISTIRAVRQAIAAAAPHRLGVFTPYVTALNDKIRASLAADGLPVTDISGLGITDNLAIGAVEPKQIVEHVAEAFAEREVDMIFVSCTNFRAAEAIPEIKQRLGVPVVTSNQAVVEAMMAALDS
jgi:maleate isomerase